MRRQMIRVIVAALAAGCLLLPTMFGQEKPKPEQYSAIWAVVGGEADGRKVPVEIRINRYETEAGMQKFADLLQKNGAEALRFALEKEDVGYLSSPNRTRVPIALARKLTEGKQTIIRMLVARDLWFMEFKFSGKSEEYPYMIVQLDLDANGKGTGTAIAAAKIRFNKKANKYEVKSLEKEKMVNTLLDVQAVKQ
jgi:hypothetical protein